jgi:hypothetical protein
MSFGPDHRFIATNPSRWWLRLVSGVTLLKKGGDDDGANDRLPGHRVHHVSCDPPIYPGVMWTPEVEREWDKRKEDPSD